MSDFVKYVVKLLGKGCPLWASVSSVKKENHEIHEVIEKCNQTRLHFVQRARDVH